VKLLKILKEAIDTQERDKLFNDLAQGQRGKPESAMHKLQKAQISQLYGFEIEHIGDLTHRMAKHPDFFKGGYGDVREKVEKTLRVITHSYGFEKEVLEQIQRNLEYFQEKGEWLDVTVEAKLKELKDLGLNYSNEHRKLKVYNEAQKHARDAAISLGEWKFDETIQHLRELKRHLDQGRDHWSEYALEFGAAS